MKNIIKIYLILTIISLFTNLAIAQVPTYTLNAKNFKRPSPDSLTFEIYLLHTNPGVTQFQYPAAQYFFRFNPLIANGGTLRYRIAGTSLPTGAVPQNPTVTGNELRLASNLPVGQTNAPIISSTDPGTLIVKMSLTTTASSFDPNQPVNITWRNSNDPPFFTKISAYVGMFIQEITTSATHFVDTTTVSINQISSIVPSEYSLNQNYPNPFNPTTNLEFGISKLGLVTLKIYDMLGKEVVTLVNTDLTPGTYKYKFDAAGLSSGIYYYRLSTNNFTQTKRMLLIK